MSNVTEEIDLIYGDALSAVESIVRQQSELHAALRRGALALTREKTQTRRRFEYALVAPHRIRRTKVVVMATDATTVEFQLKDRGDNADVNVTDTDDNDNDDDDESILPLIALGGALPSQAVRDAQAQFDDALARAIQLANETVRFNALMRQLNQLEQTTS